MIYRKSPEELDKMRQSGKILASCLDRLEEMIVPGANTAALDLAFAEMLREAGAEASFKGYRGFPASICASPNHVIVHGIPDPTPLAEGDIVSLDLGVFHEGFHADSAWTFPVGQVSEETTKLLDATRSALDAAVKQCEVGNRVGDIGYAVERVIEPTGFSLVQEYAGHGVGRSLHEEPWVPNYGPPARRERLAVGMTLAIEPMVNAGGPETKTLEDGWTVVTADESLSAHFEHTVAITEDGPEVFTLRDGA